MMSCYLGEKVGKYGDVYAYKKTRNYFNCVYVLKYGDLHYVGATRNLKTRIKKIYHSFVGSIKEHINIEVYVYYENLDVEYLKEKENFVMEELKSQGVNLANKIKSGYAHDRKTFKSPNSISNIEFDDYLIELGCLLIDDNKHEKVYIQGRDSNINVFYRLHDEKHIIFYSDTLNYFIDFLMGEYDDLEVLLYDMINFIEDKREGKALYMINRDMSPLICEFLTYELDIDESIIHELDLDELFYDLIDSNISNLLNEDFEALVFEPSDFNMGYIRKNDSSSEKYQSYSLDEDSGLYYFE